MLRRDVDEAVVAAAAHTPFEAAHRIFVLERVDVMNDEAANALLKTLEEPPRYVVLLLLTDRPDAGAADDRQPLPAGAVRPADDRAARAAAAIAAACRRTTADAAARLSLGDGEKALRARARRRACSCAQRRRAARPRAAARQAGEKPWKAILDRAARAGAQAKEEIERQLEEELQFLPKKEHKRRETEFTERARRAERRAPRRRSTTRCSSPASGTATSPCVAAGAPELVFHSRPARARSTRTRRDADALQQGAWSSSTTPAPA